MSVVLLRNSEKIATEAQVVGMYATGLNTRQISEQIGINKRTLEQKIGQIKTSYEATTIAQLVYIFLKRGLID